MRKTKVLTLAVATFVGYLLVCGYREGAAGYGSYDCTGAEVNNGTSNPANCSNNGSCHGASTSIGVKIELDSAGGKATSYYVGGGSYTIKITGTNNGTSTLPSFGFQLTATTGTTAGSTVTNAGTFPSPYPTGCTLSTTTNTSYYVANIVEQTSARAATSGTGGNGTTYVESIKWTAPAKGTGTVSLWGVINAVNGNGSADRSDLSNNAQVLIKELTPTAVNEISDNNAIQVYPNPFFGRTTFSLASEVSNASLTVYDITGREAKQVTFSGNKVTLEQGNLTSGVYFYNIVSGSKSIKTGKIIVQ